MPKKILFVGAGSYTFTRNLVKDLMTFPALQDSILVLHDIVDEKLELANRMVSRIIEEGKYPAKIVCTKNVEEAYTGADGVLCTIKELNSEKGIDICFDIPAKYGVTLTNCDTIGPSAIFQYMFVVRSMIDVCKNIDKYCPKAVFLNYTNPMSMLTRTMQTLFPHLSITGLCHSVQEGAARMAEWMGVDVKDLTYTCAGINHFSFYTELKVNGEDAYPRLLEAMKRPEVYEEEAVNLEIMKHFGYYSSENSAHKCNYVPWFRSRPDLTEKYCTFKFGDYAFNTSTPEVREMIFGAAARKKGMEDWFNAPLDLSRGKEYAACIFNAIFGDNEIFEFNGNVRNFGLIDNLPEGACVEVPMYASKKGIKATHVGALPTQVAAIANLNASVHELAVQAVLENDKEKLYRACKLDPLTSAVLSLEEIDAMVTEMLEAAAPYIPLH